MAGALPPDDPAFMSTSFMVALTLARVLADDVAAAPCGRAAVVRGCALSPDDDDDATASAAAARTPPWWLHAPKTGSSWCTVLEARTRQRVRASAGTPCSKSTRLA